MASPPKSESEDMPTSDDIKNLALFAAANLIAAVLYDTVVKPYLARRTEVTQ